MICYLRSKGTQKFFVLEVSHIKKWYAKTLAPRKKSEKHAACISKQKLMEYDLFKVSSTIYNLKAAKSSHVTETI